MFGLPDPIAFIVAFVALLLLADWWDRRDTRRSLPRWDGRDQAHPITFDAIASRAIRRLAADVKRSYPDNT